MVLQIKAGCPEACILKPLEMLIFCWQNVQAEKWLPYLTRQLLRESGGQSHFERELMLLSPELFAPGAVGPSMGLFKDALGCQHCLRLRA